MTDIALPSAQRAGQATLVEQSRAVAEVQGAIVVAQQVPRNVANAVANMRESCAHPGLANRAFFRYSRGGSQISGPSVHLARDLARCWGNVQYGLSELRRDDIAAQSEMQAWAWDVQTNARASTTFIVPHMRDKTGGPVALVDMRDIYENNANHGARRLREQILAILPPWFVEDAKELCHKTMAEGGGEPLPARIANAVRAFAEVGVPVHMLEAKLGLAQAQWTGADVAALQVVFTSIRRGETTVGDEFPRTAAAPAAKVTADKLAGAATPTPSGPGSGEAAGPEGQTTGAAVEEAPAESAGPAQDEAPDSGPAGPADASPPAAEKEPEKQPNAVTRSQLTKLSILAKELGYESKGARREEYLAAMSEIALVDVPSATELTYQQASWVIEKWQQLVNDRPKLGEDAPATEQITISEARGRVIRAAEKRGFPEGGGDELIEAVEAAFGCHISSVTVEQLAEFETRLALGTVTGPNA